MFQTDDPYTILGVPRNASQDEIKNAFRTLSKKYHPDQNDSADAEETFKKINSAYQELKNRQNTDHFNPFFNTGFQSEYANSIDLEELFRHFNAKVVKPTRRFMLPLTAKEMHEGCTKTVNVYDNLLHLDIPAGVTFDDEIGFTTNDQKYRARIVFSDPHYSLENGNLMTIYRISAHDFTTLNSIEIENHVGKKYNIDIQKNIDTQKSLRIPKAGLYNEHKKTYGDFLVRLVVYK